MDLDGLKKKISLKVMTLNNSKQKVNDCLGNPIEIGIAVMWRVVDTAKAVFTVDNYKEYLSLQCDSAVRNNGRRRAGRGQPARLQRPGGRAHPTGNPGQGAGGGH